jgi:dihydroxyacetone kinase
LQPALRAVAQALLDHEATLTELDTAAGDGDLGEHASRRAGDPRAAGHRLRRAGRYARGARCGARSPAVRDRSMRARCCAHRGALPTRRTPSRRPRATGRLLRGAADAISELGGARAGDRTMLDALVPAADAFGRALDHDHDVASAWAAAVQAAEHGARQTADMPPRGTAISRRARARYAGWRRRGRHVLAARVAAARAVGGRLRPSRAW